jgi:hypothetical protein
MVEECGSTMVFLVEDASFCSTSASVFRASFRLELEYDDSELLLYFLMFFKGWIKVCFGVLFDWLKCFIT